MTTETVKAFLIDSKKSNFKIEKLMVNHINMAIFDRENYNIFCSIVTYPVVPKGVILLRLIPTAVHSLEEVDYTIKSFSEIKDKLARGLYISEKIANV